MVWQRNDDQYGISKKVTRIPRAIRLAAVGLDQLAMNYSVRSLTDGLLDENELAEVLATDALVDALVKVDRWHRAGHDCARCVQPPLGAIVIHDFLVYNPDAASVRAGRAEQSEGGRHGNHVRWHAKKGVSDPSCEWCATETRSPKRRRSESVRESPTESLPHPPVPDPGPVPRQTDLTHLLPVSPDSTAQAELDEEIDSLADEARAVGIRNLRRVMRALERVVGQVSPAIAIDTTRSVVLLATQPVKLPEPYLEAACTNSPETVRAEWQRVVASSPKAAA